MIAACSPSPDAATPGLPHAGGARASAGAPLMVLEGRPVRANEVSPLVYEAAGGLVVEELALDEALRRELSRRGAVIDDADISAERALLIETLASDAGVSGNDAARALASVRRQRGLGPARFGALLWRNAALRKLSASDADTSDASFAEFVAREFGPRVRARVITLPTPVAATALRATLIEKPPGEIREAFANAAFEQSTDPGTAARGGLLADVSPTDPTLSPPIAEALRTLAPMQVSGVLSLERGVALVLVESRAEGRDADAAQIAAARERFVVRAQREVMNRLARRLVASLKPTIMDESLGWSWENRPGN